MKIQAIFCAICFVCCSLALGATEDELQQLVKDAIAADGRGDYTLAAKTFRRAHELEPREPYLANNYGVALMRLGRDHLIHSRRKTARAVFVQALQAFHVAINTNGAEKDIGENLRDVLAILKTNFDVQIPQKEVDLLEMIGVSTKSLTSDEIPDNLDVDQIIDGPDSYGDDGEEDDGHGEGDEEEEEEDFVSEFDSNFNQGGQEEEEDVELDDLLAELDSLGDL